MKLKHLIISLSLVLFFLSSCNVTYKVLTTDNELEELLHMPCGKLTIEMIGKGNSKFTVTQHFDLKEKITINPSAFEAYYNGNQVDIKLLDKTFKDLDRDYEVSGNDQFDYFFELNEGVFDGDTIALIAPRYIKCMGDFVGLDTVYYTFRNRLRIYGVNAL